MLTSRRRFAPSPFQRRMEASGSSGSPPWQTAWHKRLPNNRLSRLSTQSLLTDSYGHRPGKLALDAVGVTRQRCWKYDLVLEFDIKGLFDNIDHELLLRAVRKHVTCAWALLYIDRWLTAPMVQEDAKIIERSRDSR